MSVHGLVALSALALFACDTLTMLRYWLANLGSETEWANGVQRTEIPFRMHDNLMLVRLAINGAEPLDFVLDTGAPYPFILDTEATRALGLPITDEIDFAGYDARITRGLRLSLGNVALTEMTAAIMPPDLLPFVHTPKGVVAHGILGYEIFRRFVAELDYEREVITLYDPEAYTYRGNTAPIPLTFDDRKPYAMFDATLPSGEEIAVKLHVDTGKTGTLHLDVPSDPRISAPPAGIPIEMRSLKGATHGLLARLPRLRLGAITAENLVIEYRTHDARGQRAGRNGFLGNEVLRRYRVTLDYPGERMWIERTARSDLAYEHDRSGVELAHVWHDGYAIESVAADSPADRAGIAKGDQLVSVDGTSAETYYAHEIRALLRGAPGESVEICVTTDGTGERCYALRLESLL